MKQPIILGLGSNLGQRLSCLQHGCAALPTHVLDPHTIRHSSVYETDPLLPHHALDTWKALPYLNMAVYGHTSLAPAALLDAIKAIESQLGPRNPARGSPRALDMDILAYGESVYHSPILTIPHPALLERRFALVPLAALWPTWCYPVPGPWMGVEAKILVQRLDATLLPHQLQEVHDLNR